MEFVLKHLLFNREDSPIANLMLSVVDAFVEFERPTLGNANGKVRLGQGAWRLPGGLSDIPGQGISLRRYVF